MVWGFQFNCETDTSQWFRLGPVPVLYLISTHTQWVLHKRKFQKCEGTKRSAREDTFNGTHFAFNSLVESIFASNQPYTEPFFSVGFDSGGTFSPNGPQFVTGIWKILHQSFKSPCLHSYCGCGGRWTIEIENCCPIQWGFDLKNTFNDPVKSSLTPRSKHPTK